MTAPVAARERCASGAGGAGPSTRPGGARGPAAVAARIAQIALIALAAALPYARTLGYGFVYDDVPVIVEQPALQTPAGLTRAWSLPYWPAATGRAPGGLYRPVSDMVYAALWNAGGGRPAPFHWYAVLLHVGVSLLLFALLARAVPRWAAVAGALLFAVHPVHVEAVANIVGSAEVLAALASLAFVSVLWRGEREAGVAAPLGWDCALVAALLYGVALGAKETAAALPGMGLLLWWGWRTPRHAGAVAAPSAALALDAVAPARDRGASVLDRGAPAPTLRALVRRGWRVWLLCAVVLASLAWARWRVLGELAPGSDAVAAGIQLLGPLDRAWTMIGAWPLIAQLLVWPARLSMHYGTVLVPPQDGASLRTALALGAALAVAALAAWRARRGERRPAAALGWMALAYLPASNLLVPTGQLLAERTLYVPSIGVLLLGAWLLQWVAARTPPAARAVPLLAGAVVVVAVAGAGRTARGSAVWRDNLTLFQSGIAAAPLEYRPYFAAGSELLNRGDTLGALPYLERGFALYPRGARYARDPALALEIAPALVRAGQQERALAIVRAAAREMPRYAELRVYYFKLLFDVRGADSVIAEVRRAGAADALGAVRYLFLSRAFAAREQPDSATAALGEGVTAFPRDAALRYLYAQALAGAGRDRDAARALEAAVALGGLSPTAVAALRAKIARARAGAAG